MTCIDARHHDVIDVAILTDTNDTDANADIVDSLRTAMTTLAPNHSEDTKEHFLRDAKLFPLVDCVTGKPCRLKQSQFTLRGARVRRAQGGLPCDRTRMGMVGGERFELPTLSV